MIIRLLYFWWVNLKDECGSVKKPVPPVITAYIGILVRSLVYNNSEQGIQVAQARFPHDKYLFHGSTEGFLQSNFPWLKQHLILPQLMHTNPFALLKGHTDTSVKQLQKIFLVLLGQPVTQDLGLLLTGLIYSCRPLLFWGILRHL